MYGYYGDNVLFVSSMSIFDDTFWLYTGFAMGRPWVELSSNGGGGGPLITFTFSCRAHIIFSSKTDSEILCNNNQNNGYWCLMR